MAEARIGSAEVDQMTSLLEKAGFEHPHQAAEQLHAEGMGPEVSSTGSSTTPARSGAWSTRTASLPEAPQRRPCSGC